MFLFLPWSACYALQPAIAILHFRDNTNVQSNRVMTCSFVPTVCMKDSQKQKELSIIYLTQYLPCYADKLSHLRFYGKESLHFIMSIKKNVGGAFPSEAGLHSAYAEAKSQFSQIYEA